MSVLRLLWALMQVALLFVMMLCVVMQLSGDGRLGGWEDGCEDGRKGGWRGGGEAGWPAGWLPGPPPRRAKSDPNP